MRNNQTGRPPSDREKLVRDGAHGVREPRSAQTIDAGDRGEHPRIPRGYTHQRRESLEHMSSTGSPVYAYNARKCGRIG